MNTVFGTAIFEKDFPFEGPHLVAASAGTGKTYNIQNICARLVAEKGFRVDEIQVMTFTEAATKELRDRIRKVLALFRTYLEEGAGAIDDQREIPRLEQLAECVDANTTREEALDRLNRAIMDFDRAAISTIHGFCHRVLARYAFETRSSFEMQIATDSSEEVEALAREWWRENAPQIPKEIAQKISFEIFLSYVKTLAGKSNYEIEKTDNPTPKQWLLEQAATVAREYAGECVTSEQQTFDGLLSGLQNALNDERTGPFLAAKLREEYKAVLVDEFQDTDPVQFDIFRIAFLDTADKSRPPIFFVGDPKQAIYAFRGADINTYSGAATRPDVAAMTYHLDKNFRSTPNMIDAVNILFKDDDRGDTFGDPTIDYTEDLLSNPERKALKENGIDDPAPFRVFKADGAQPAKSAVVDGVLELLSRPEKDVNPKDIAILVTSHQAGGELMQRLREKGVPVVLQHAGNVFSSPTAQEFRTVLQAMSLEGGVKRARAALATRFFNVTSADLVADEDDSMVADMLGFFAEVNEVWRKRGFDTAFRKLECHPRCNFKERISTMPGGERDLADIMQINDLACKAVREIGPAPEALINWLTDRINASGDKTKEQDVEEYARELESEADAVKIMTIHVSKGLQFPVVFVLLPQADTTAPDATSSYHDATGKLIIDTCESKNEGAKREKTDERTRLLYVAMTRAEKRTVVIMKEKLASWPTPRLVDRAVARMAGGDCPQRITVDVRDEKESLLPPYKAECSFAGVMAPAAEVGRDFISKRPSRGSYTSLAPVGGGGDSEGHDFDSDEPLGKVEEDEEINPIFTLAGGAKAGICWHAILEEIPFAADIKEISRMTSRMLKVHGLADEDEEKFLKDVQTVSDMIQKTLRYRMLAPDGKQFSLCETDPAARFSEWEFHFPSLASRPWTTSIKAVLEKHWAGDEQKQSFIRAMANWNRPVPEGFIKGYLDLVFRHDGYYYVVDWKSNQLRRDVANFNARGITAEMADAGYFFQYMLYAAVLHQFLKETLKENYSWERNFGGIQYFFLRGIAAGGEAPVFSDRPSEALLDELAAVLGL